ncbi:MAG TPA: cytochrome-c peroxidase [Casimicrobiaceae bacterium]
MNSGERSLAGVLARRLLGTVVMLAWVGALATITWRDQAYAAGADPTTPNPVSLGEELFADPSLSASGTLACASCHDPAHAHAQSSELAVQLGGAGMDVPGFRAVPSLNYLSFTPPFSLDADDTPSGGFDRGGRADDLMTQALRPLFAAHEMANATPADLVGKLSRTAYADEFRQVFGEHVLDDEKATLLAVTFALAQYQKLDPEFRPFDSKYDLFLAGKVSSRPPSCAGWRCSIVPTRGTAPRVIRAAAARTASRRCSPISATTNSVFRATQRSRRRRIRRMPTWGCAGLIAKTSRNAPTCAEPSRCRLCATSPRARFCFTTVALRLCAMRCAST